LDTERHCLTQYPRFDTAIQRSNRFLSKGGVLTPVIFGDSIISTMDVYDYEKEILIKV